MMICHSSEELSEEVKKSKEGDLIIFDEARMLSDADISRLKRVHRKLRRMLKKRPEVVSIP